MRPEGWDLSPLLQCLIKLVCDDGPTLFRLSREPRILLQGCATADICLSLVPNLHPAPSFVDINVIP